MIGESVKQYQGRNIALETLKERVETALRDDGFLTQSSPPSPHGVVIQARREGWLRDIFAGDRALTILLGGDPNDFTVRVGIGRWMDGLGTTAVEALLLSRLFLLVEVPEIPWDLEVDRRVLRQIDSLVEEKVAARAA